MSEADINNIEENVTNLANGGGSAEDYADTKSNDRLGSG